MFIYHFVCGAEVCYDICACYAHGGAWRVGHPHIFTYFHSEFCVFYAEKKIDPEWDCMAVDVDNVIFLPLRKVKFKPGG